MILIIIISITRFLLFLSSRVFLHRQQTFYARKHLASDWELLHLDLYPFKIDFWRVWCRRHSNLFNVSLLLLFLFSIIDSIEDFSTARIVLGQAFELLNWNKVFFFLYLPGFSPLIIHASMMMLKQVEWRNRWWFRFGNDLPWFRG